MGPGMGGEKRRMTKSCVKRKREQSEEERRARRSFFCEKAGRGVSNEVVCAA